MAGFSALDGGKLGVLEEPPAGEQAVGEAGRIETASLFGGAIQNALRFGSPLLPFREEAAL